MLEYENQMFLEILHEDGLIITAKGLGLDTVFINLLKAYSDPGHLVIVLGTTNKDEQYFIEKLRSQNEKHLPRVITAEVTSSEREITYLDGGVLFMSGRILVVDLLKSRVPLHLVSGILVYRAHKILNSHQEVFAIRLYRQTNKTGFIKAFSNSALAFNAGFAQVERVMRTLFIKQLYLWPRFHSVVTNSLSTYKPQVIELHVKLTPKMLKIQSLLLDVMNYLIKELKRINKYIDLDELTVENAIAKKFHKQLQQQLDPMWHQLSKKTKQLISEIKTLRSLLMSLAYDDSVSFYELLNRLRSKEYVINSSGWLLLDIVEELFKCTKERVYTDKNELKPEANPKWTILSEIILEIQNHNKKRSDLSGQTQKVLILVQDTVTCYQLKNVLIKGPSEYLLYQATKKIQFKETNKQSFECDPETSSNTEKNENVEEDTEQDSYVLTLSQKPSTHIELKSPGDSEQFFEEYSQIAELDLTTFSTSVPLIVIQSLKKASDPMALQRTLLEMMPSYVIMYAADISAVRQVEVYQNYNPAINLCVYFLIYGGSVEEQAYLSSLRREKDAFERLIRDKSSMVVPADQDGKTEDCAALSTKVNNPFNEENTRQGGLQTDGKVIEKVVVDMREFGCELPTILHNRGIEIDPVTLLIGDYILSPDICIERKSISDLIGSLQSGRLYTQVMAMNRHYHKPMLLIEFDQNKPFCLQRHYYVSKGVDSKDVTSKLQLLTMHFPRLKLVWSPNPHASAQLFEELKKGKDQPDGARAVLIGTHGNAYEKEVMANKYNACMFDFMMQIPGVTSKNIYAILNKGISLDQLISHTEEQLIDIVGNKQDAQILYNGLHTINQTADDIPEATVSRTISRVRERGLFYKRNRSS
ncbi:DNA repair endonuclease XPF [Orussus abietinus]|uniref:DNA repair endonuclease XPF n=1 Tax=Orussus abietinus TaxID=222816 RepID=UPI000625169B|nr:DNA repair endonuclease XPF [Orussus abietinus]